MPARQQKTLARVILTLISGALIFSALAAIAFFASRPQAAVIAGRNAEVEIPPKAEDVAGPPPAATGQETLSQKVNDVLVEITSARVISTGVEIGICYATPDGGDWYPTPGPLFYDTYEVLPDEYEFTTEKKADGRNQGRRCALVRYRIEELESLAAPIRFTIIDFEARPLEMFSPCQNFQERLRTSPKARSYGLKAVCTENTNDGISVRLIDHGKAHALDVANQALTEIAAGLVRGPWEFTINNLQK